MVSFTSFPRPQECANRWLSGREVQVQAGYMARDLVDEEEALQRQKSITSDAMHNR